MKNPKQNISPQLIGEQKNNADNPDYVFTGLIAIVFLPLILPALLIIGTCWLIGRAISLVTGFYFTESNSWYEIGRAHV